MTYHKKSTWEWIGRGYFGEWRAEGLLTWLELRKEINQIWPSSHHDSSLVILFSRSHSRKPCRLWTSSGRHMACAIMTLQDTGTRLCDYLVCWTHKTLHQSHRLLPTLGRTHGKAQEFEKLLPINHKGGTASMSHTPVQYWLFIYQKCQMRMVSRSARSVIVAGQIRKCEDSVILSLVASVVLCMLRVPKPGVQIKDMILTRLRLETTLRYTGL